MSSPTVFVYRPLEQADLLPASNAGVASLLTRLQYAGPRQSAIDRMLKTFAESLLEKLLVSPKSTVSLFSARSWRVTSPRGSRPDGRKASRRIQLPTEGV